MKHLNKSLILRVAFFLLLELIAIVSILFFTPPFGRNISYSGVYLSTLVPFRNQARTSHYISKQKNNDGLAEYHYANSTNTMIYKIEALKDDTYLLRYTSAPGKNANHVNTKFRITSSKLEILRKGTWQTPWAYINELDSFELVIFLSVEAAATKLKLPMLISVSIILSLLSAVLIPFSRSARFKSVRIVLSSVCVLLNLLWSARFLL